MKPQEKRLLFLFLGLLLVGGGVVLFDLYQDKKQTLLAEKTNLENEWITIETLFEDKTMWDIRSEWLERNQPEFTSDEIVTQEIFKKSLAADISGLATAKQALLPVKKGPYAVESGVSFTARGDLKSVFRWVYDLTEPTSFRVIRNLKISPDKDNRENVVTAMELLRWYAPKS